MTKSFVRELYESHHRECRTPGFSILKEERGGLFSQVIGRGKEILDLGCRDGALTSMFKDGNEVIGIDVDTNALKEAQKLGIKTIEMDLYGDWGDLNGKKFDVVVAGEVLEHVFTPEKIIEKTKSHLNESGIFIGSVPNAFSLRNRFRYLFGSKKNSPLADPTHVNHFSYAELEGIFLKHFDSVELVGLGRYGRLSLLAPNFFAFDIVFIASKPKYE